MDEAILSVRGLSKYYAGVKALDGVSLDFRRGEIHALCGENGAGKSTFIKLITGAIAPTEGTIRFEGRTYNRLGPRQAIDLGIAAIYQEFSLIPYLTVVENIFLGRELGRCGIRDRKKMSEAARELCEEMGVEIDIDARICDLGIAYQQIVEILKAVSRNSKLIIMDEPTAPLTLKETNVFFGIVDRLKKGGSTIVYISHRLEEVFEVSDRITVLCDGKLVVTKDVADIDRKRLISYMVGREIADDYPVPRCGIGDVLLRVEGLSNNNVKDISLELRRGEILGFGGLVGAGRTELARAIFGADPISSGSMTLKGKHYAPKSPQAALRGGVGLIPEDRKNQGVVLGMSVKDNIVYSSMKRICRLLMIDRKKERSCAERQVKDLRIKTPGLAQLVRNLSGGNQQKVVLAKMMATECDLFIFDEPTRGIDVGAKQEIYLLMRDLVEAGASVIMISSEMPELIGMSNRIMVMGCGRILAELRKQDFSQERILEIASSKVTNQGSL
jgi:ribose transport system ATP-binding protein